MVNTLIAQMVETNSIEEVWAIHSEKMGEYGFDRLIYGYTRFRTGAALGDIQDAVILTNHDPEYVDVFVGEGMYFKGPMLNWAAENVGACSWRLVHKVIAEGKLTPDEMEAMALNIRLEVTAGYTISFHDISLRAKGAIGLTARRGMTQDDVEEIWEKHGPDIELLNKIMHLKVSQLPNMGMRRKLTSRQREVLEWVADGKTIQDTATIMGLNPATVEKHLRLAREALDVDTTAQAILKASSQNQFFLIEH